MIFIPGWLFLVKPERKEIGRLLDFMDTIRGICVEYYGFLSGTIKLKNGKSFGVEGKRMPLIMPNSVNQEQIIILIDKGFLTPESVVDLADIGEEYIMDTEDRGLIVRNVEYVEYNVFLYRISAPP